MSAADQIQPVKGTFWQADTPHRRVPGELMLTDSPILEILVASLMSVRTG